MDYEQWKKTVSTPQSYAMYNATTVRKLVDRIEQLEEWIAAIEEWKKCEQLPQPYPLYNAATVRKLVDRIARLENALQDIADEKTFNHYDCADCTEEVYEAGKSLVQTARDVLQEGE